MSEKRRWNSFRLFGKKNETSRSNKATENFEVKKESSNSTPTQESNPESPDSPDSQPRENSIQISKITSCNDFQNNRLQARQLPANSSNGPKSTQENVQAHCSGSQLLKQLGMPNQSTHSGSHLNSTFEYSPKEFHSSDFYPSSSNFYPVSYPSSRNFRPTSSGFNTMNPQSSSFSFNTVAVNHNDQDSDPLSLSCSSCTGKCNIMPSATFSQRNTQFLANKSAIFERLPKRVLKDQNYSVTVPKFPHNFANRSASVSLNLRNRSRQGSFSFETASVFEPDWTDFPTCSPQPVQQVSARSKVPETPPPSPPSEPRIRVLITYAQEDQYDKGHEATVDNIVKTLIKNGIEVSYDKLEQRQLDKSVSDWLDWSLENSNFILICISPSYLNVVNSATIDDAMNLSTKNGIRQTKYVYKRVQTEYIRNLSKNKRLLPVLVGKASEEHVPKWLGDTKIYEWPGNYKEIFYRLRNVEPYLAPPIGKMTYPYVHYYNQNKC